MYNKFSKLILPTAIIVQLLFSNFRFCTSYQYELLNPNSSIICTYKLSYKLDSTSNDFKQDIFNLYINNGKSKFQSISTHLRDSLVNATPQLPTSQAGLQRLADIMSSFPKGDFRYSVYKEAATGEVYYYTNIGPTLYRQKMSSVSFDWKIINRTMMISGYSCQQATVAFAGRQYEAWFTRQVPISEGPYKFFGLPGLIIKINDIHNNYSFELVKLSTNRPIETIIFPANAATATSMLELQEAQKNFDLEIPDRMASMGNTISSSRRKEMRDRVLKRNNQLELK